MNEEKKQKKVPIIAVGASAGGLEAIEALIQNMPETIPYAIVVIQHLSPDYKSMMMEILSKRTAMPVHRSENNMKVRKGHIYLIPPKKNMTIFHGCLLLSDQHPKPKINFPIDIFFQSAAEDLGEHAIAVILSGTGSDGMRGVRAVKEKGGIVIVQKEDSARFDGMPRAAISTGLADLILLPEEIPQQIIAFTNKPIELLDIKNNSEASHSDELLQIFSFMNQRCKVDFTGYKPTTVNRRLERRMIACQVATVRDYLKVLEDTPSEINTLCRELLIGVTSFFRDQDVWDEIEESLLPALVQQSGGDSLRFWIAGCSTGEEAYSLAILINSVIRQENPAADIKIFATDIDREAVLQASDGAYPESIAADVPEHFLHRYFFKKNENYQVSRTVRESVVFAQHNLLVDPPFTNIDMVICRNLLIYFKPELQKRVLEYFHFSVKENGFVVLGKSESTGELVNYYQVYNNKLKIFKPVGNLTRNIGPGIKMSTESRQNRQLRVSGSNGDNRRLFSHENTIERFLNTLGESLLPFTVIIDEHMEILHVIGDTGRFFRIASGRPSLKLDKLIHQDLKIPVSTGIAKVLRKGTEIRFTRISVKEGDSTVYINMRIVPIPGKKIQPPLLAVLLESDMISDDSRTGGRNPAEYDLSQEAEQRIRDLEQELQFTKENLQAAVEELETANEELQATNEELVASNEELQSTNEELQSTNEELYTVNTEYHTKIIELTDANNDIDNILSNVNVSIMLIDENLEIRRFSSNVSDVFKILDSDVGRPVSGISHYIEDLELIDTIQQVISSGISWEGDIHTSRNKWFFMSISEYAVSPQANSGLMISFVDIDRLKKTEGLLHIKKDILHSLGDIIALGGWEYDIESGNMFWAQETYDLYGLNPADFEPDSVSLMEASMEHYEDGFRQEVEKAFQLCIAEGTSYNLIGNLIKQDGSVIRIRTSGIPLMEEGRLVKVVGFIINLTDSLDMTGDNSEQGTEKES